jgi:hypothetical protein
MKSITLHFTDYVIKGIADVTAWGGGNARIKMASFHVKNLKDIKENLNDNGFGVESINGAICEVYLNYEGTLKFSKTIIIGKVSKHTEEYYYQTLK